ncbi:MAG: hypothetical protein OMM_00265 [Candidatus Magnetoglobus multicellularis str. Araruama]|uniref:Uncharacterized protein n=1 Tax=Candidatus Magnetoglobus multicellularis str. Araruama TaxID=890399 RepID=A0A1V1PHZ4_9BACT|nr:MAG: hypothetical protein OMM_00265 [Candidatus Magnetoglobus multicellularis str. Araruama]
MFILTKEEKTMKKLAIIMSTLILSMATFTWASNDSCPEGDINGNCNIGLEDAIFILKILAKHTDSQNQRDMEDVTNMNTRALSEAQSEVENLDHLASILAVIDLPANQPQKRNQTQDLFERLIESNMSCADISQDENAVVITFNQNPLCLGMSGSVRIIADSGAHSLVFEGVSTGNCVIEGKIIATITYNNENVVAELSFEDMSICGHPIDEDYTITYDKITGLLKSVDLKERLLTYVFENQNVQFPFQAVYDRLKGFTGSSTITRNGQTYNCQFKDFITNSMSGLPKTGIMNINDIQLDFKQQFSPDNPVISYIENDLPVQLKLTANKIQKGAKEFVAEIASQYQDVIGEISNIGALIVSKHGKDIEMLKQMAALPGTMKMTEYTSDSGINFNH